MSNLNGKADEQGGQDSKGSSEFWQLLKFLTGSGLLIALVFWPYTFGQLAGIWEPDVVTNIGTVQSIHFVGGFGIKTQIDTESRVFLVRDFVNLPRGTPLQMRKSYFGREICVTDTKKCWAAFAR